MPSDDPNKNIQDIEKKLAEEKSAEVLADENSQGVRAEITEKKEHELADSASEQKVRQELDAIHADEDLKNRTPVATNNSQITDDDYKVAQLLEVAKKKGVEVAVKAAKNMDNPYILDKLHDALIEKGYKTD